MRLFLDFLISPTHFLNSSSASKHLHLFTGIFLLLSLTFLDFILMFKIGRVQGGNPCLWFIIGGLLEVPWIQKQTLLHQWLILYPLKISADAALIFLPALTAKKFYHATKETILLWTKVYCYYAGVLDVFLCMAMLPTVLSGSTASSLLTTNLLSYLVFGANMLYFTHAYQTIFRINFDQALKGWFFPWVALPMSISAIIFWSIV